MLVNLKTILADAYAKGYAVGSFNAYNFETIRGIIEAGQNLKQPLILAFGASYLKNMKPSTVYAIVQDLTADSDVPVCLHLDHCSDLQVIQEAIDCGFGSVMYDGSKLSFEENVANTAMVVQMAHAKSCGVEAELGSLATGDFSHEGTDEDVESYTSPQSAKSFVEQTGVDALAVSIGTVHGLYKGEPNIRIDILKAINEQAELPLVLHGGSGTPEDTIRQCIANGIAKINVNTEISMYVIEQSIELLNKERLHFSQLSLKQIQWVSQVVTKYMNLFN